MANVPSIFMWLRSSSTFKCRRSGRGLPFAVAVPLALVVGLGAALATPQTVEIAAANVVSIMALAETDPVPHDDDAADDPAIWVNPSDAAASTIIGTDKQGGIAVYDLSGSELQYLEDGELNNIDLRSDFSLGGEAVTLVTAGNRTDNSIAIYQIDPLTGLLSDVASRKITVGLESYGSCMYRDTGGETYYIVNSKEGEVEQWRLIDDGSGRVDAEMMRSFDAGSQLEGCVADDEFGRLYIGEEEVGI